MRKLLWGILLCTSAARGASLSQFLQKPGTLTTAHFVKISDGSTLFELLPTQLMRPASVTKLITGAVALEKFSPSFTYKTNIFHTGSQRGSVIQGDIILVGAGDPFLVSEILWQMAADLKNMGIRSITGDILIDNSLFDDESRDASRREGNQASIHAYDAPITAFSLNFNTLAIGIAPGDTLSSKALVNFDPYPIAGAVLQNSVTTGSASSKSSTQVSRTGSALNFRASGSIPIDESIKKVYRSVGDPILASGEIFRAFCHGAGITIKGKVRTGKKPATSKLLYQIEGYPMSRVVAGLNKFSNNFIADMLVKKMGADFGGKNSGASMNDGVKVINEFLKNDVGITSEFVIRNGSGLSIENQLSAQQLTKVLQYAEKDFAIYPEFLASLPASGADGTLAKRFGKRNAEELLGLVRAKTGTLTEPVSVSSLAGYVRHPKHGLVAFAIIQNGIQGKAQPNNEELKRSQDQAMEFFIKQ